MNERLVASLRRSLRPSPGWLGPSLAACARLVAPLLLALALIAVSGTGPSATALAQAAMPGRIALVIGNAAYPDGKLATSLNDARAMADALRKIGFDVSLAEDLSRKATQAAVTAFRDKIKPGSIAVFYYAGQAIQVARRNYMLPIDAEPGSAIEVPSVAFGVSQVFDQAPPDESGARITILDASRSNPAEQRFRGFSAGLAKPDVTPGTVVALSANPAKVAPDHAGDVDIYTSEVVAALQSPGLGLGDLFNQVRAKVSAATNGEQVPCGGLGPRSQAGAQRQDDGKAGARAPGSDSRRSCRQAARSCPYATHACSDDGGPARRRRGLGRRRRDRLLGDHPDEQGPKRFQSLSGAIPEWPLCPPGEKPHRFARDAGCGGAMLPLPSLPLRKLPLPKLPLHRPLRARLPRPPRSPPNLRRQRRYRRPSPRRAPGWPRRRPRAARRSKG